MSHITQRASGAERLFHEDDDYLEMLVRLKKVSETYEIEFVAFVLMPNHVHFLLQQNEANLHEAMRDLFSQYARRHNKKYERKGHLFGGRYRQAVCLDESYFLAVSLYIHLNPVRAGLVVQPTDYRWSSCRLFTESPATQSFVSPQRILELLSPDSQEAQGIYRGMLEEGRKIKMGEVFEDRRAIHDLQWRLPSVFNLAKRQGGKKIPGRTVDLSRLYQEEDCAKARRLKKDLIQPTRTTTEVINVILNSLATSQNHSS
jgi:putative transposase